MIQLAFLTNEVAWGSQKTKRLLNELPTRDQDRSTYFKRWEDRQAFLIGRHLLKGLLELNKYPAPLEALRSDEFKRPYLEGLPDFNISHTDGLVGCALITSGGQVGLDVERNKSIPISELRRVFTDREYSEITGHDQSLDLFYHYWTKKEAVMKADGRGFYLDPASFDAGDDPVFVKSKRWYCQALKLPGGFTGHVATNRPTLVEFVDVSL